MMLHPSYTDLINAVNADVELGEQPVVQSRYSIVIATAKRARQLVNGEEPLVPQYEKGSNDVKKPLSIAIEEVYKKKVRIVNEDEKDGN